MTGTEAIMTELVREWAVGTLGEWLPGYISADHGQYRVRQLGGYPGTDQVGGVFEVEASDHRPADPRRFVVAVVVSDVTGAPS